ncbi:MAG: type II secretion system minor pseudopilin GspH [Pseudomonadota bacterium]
MNRQRPDQGFTLIEILVVITIMAVLTSMVILTFSGADQRQLHDGEVERLALRLDLARQRAVQRNREVGLHLELNGFEFVELDPDVGGWRPLEQRPFQPAEYGTDVVLTLTVEGAGNESDDDDDPGLFDEPETDGVDQRPPDLVFFRSGEVTPFSLGYELADASQRWTVASDGLSSIQMTAAETP